MANDTGACPGGFRYLPCSIQAASTRSLKSVTTASENAENSSGAYGRSCSTTLFAVTVDLKCMADDSESQPFDVFEVIFQIRTFAQTDGGAAFQAYRVMMVIPALKFKFQCFAVLQVDLTYKTQSGQCQERSIHSIQADFGVFFLNRPVNLYRGAQSLSGY